MFAQSTLAALLVLTISIQSTLAAECARTYQVVQGDICDSISAAKNVSTYQLAVVNSDKIDPACSNLQPGDTICLGNKGEDCSETYVVQKDDTCDIVANKSGINSTILYMNNPQLNQECGNMYIGEVLCISKQVQVPPPPTGTKQAEKIPTDNSDDEDLPYCDEL